MARSTNRSRLSFGRLLPLGAIAWLVIRAYVVVAVYRRLDEFEFRAVPPPPLPLPTAVALGASLLSPLGFRALGVIESGAPWQALRPSWVMVDSTNTVVSVLTGCRPGFGTYWAAGAHVTTAIARRTFDTATPGSRHVAAKGNTGQIYRRHLDEVEAFGQTWGKPLSMLTVSDIVTAQRATDGPDRAAYRAMWKKPEALLPYAVILLSALAVIALSR
jgi:hypothetical protein